MASMSAADFGQFAQGSQESSEESQTSPSPFPSSMHESTANATWSRMLQGNKRFAEGKAEHPWQDKETRNMLTDGQKPDEQSLHEAACLAAWFSQGSQGKKIPVDYTPVKFVKKPAGARPGMVVYTTYQTAYVDPDPKLAEKLKP